MNFFIKMNKINHQLCWLIYVLFYLHKRRKEQIIVLGGRSLKAMNAVFSPLFS